MQIICGIKCLNSPFYSDSISSLPAWGKVSYKSSMLDWIVPACTPHSHTEEWIQRRRKMLKTIFLQISIFFAFLYEFGYLPKNWEIFLPFFLFQTLILTIIMISSVQYYQPLIDSNCYWISSQKHQLIDEI